MRVPELSGFGVRVPDGALCKILTSGDVHGRRRFVVPGAPIPHILPSLRRGGLVVCGNDQNKASRRPLDGDELVETHHSYHPTPVVLSVRA